VDWADFVTPEEYEEMRRLVDLFVNEIADGPPTTKEADASGGPDVPAWQGERPADVARDADV
jgi:hypothetical protein